MEKIKLIDFISSKPELYFKKHDRVKTFIGGLLSLVSIVFTTAALAFFSLDFIGKENPTVNQSTYYSNNKKNYLTKDNFYTKFGVFNGNGKPLETPDEYFRIVALEYNYQYVLNNVTNKKETKLIKKEVPLTRCNSNYMAEYFPQFKDEPTDHFFCLAPEFNITMYNPFGNIGENSYLNIFFAFCDNSTISDGKTCKPLDEIETTLSQYNVKFGFSDYYIDHNNYTSPYQTYLNFKSYTGDLLTYNRYILLFKDVDYITDVGILLKEDDKKSRVVYETNEQWSRNIPESKKAVPYTFQQYTISYSRSGFHNFIKRNYKKLQHVLADTGGFVKGILVFAEIIAYFFSKTTYWHHLTVHNLFPITSENNREHNKESAIISILSKNKVSALKNQNFDKDVLSNQELHGINYAQRARQEQIINQAKEASSKIKCVKPTMRDNSKMLICGCMKKKQLAIRQAELFRDYNKSILNVDNVIQMSGDLTTLKDLFFDKNQKRFFNILSRLKSLNSLEEEITKKDFENEGEVIPLIESALQSLSSCKGDLTTDLLNLYLKKVKNINI